MVSVADFDKICRVCSKWEEEMISFDTTQIIPMLTACTSIEFDDPDGLPQQICRECFVKLQICYSFKRKCENTDSNLKYILNNQNFTPEEPNFEPIIKQSKASEPTESPNVAEVTKKLENYTQFPSSIARNQLLQKILKENQQEVDEEIIATNLYQQNLLQPNERDEVITYTCEKCFEEFDYVGNLAEHMKNDHKIPGTKCISCKFEAYHPLHMTLHEKIHQVEYTKLNGIYTMVIPCNFCGESFYSYQNYFDHLQVHKLNQPRQCKFCPKTFVSVKSLQTHYKGVHSLPFKCKLCPMNFKYQFDLAKHALRHKNGTRFEPCPNCGGRFSLKVDFERHIENCIASVDFIHPLPFNMQLYEVDGAYQVGDFPSSC